ncbi:MAG: cadherin-like beta sandwich domain-containing protein [Lachnospiraceae bacterium]|nr:cadherin-like beta sandwich domain-containing protein [Lachnospiraceae bacterium]
MMKWFKKCRAGILLAAVLVLAFAMQVLASDDDNSLSSLGIQTEGATVSPEFSYDTWSYTVTVPAGTTELSLDPVPSSGNATISDISGTTLDADGKGYVTITVQAGGGSTFTYELNVVSDGTAPAVTQTEAQTETETEKETEKETEPETEDSRYVKVDKNSLQEAENTITDLKSEITNYKDKVGLFTKIMYGLIALAVILLFVVINLLLKKKDLKAELNDYRSYGYSNSPKGQKQEEKQQKKVQKNQKGQAVSYPDDNDFRTYPTEPQAGVKPASMHNAPVGQPYGAGTAQPFGYDNLDVRSQQSQKKGKKMPQYEQKPVSQPQAPQPKAPVDRQPQAPANQPAGQNGKGKKQGKKSDVEVTMIDL